MKVKNNLTTVSAESINWLKDSDVTWLYGPLQSTTKPIHDARVERSSISQFKTDSQVNLNKKPILKKRSMSKITLQRPLSTTSLLDQAATTIQAQETQGILQPSNNRRGTVDNFAYPSSSRRMSVDSSGLASPTDSSGVTSTHAKRRQIRFNEQVEQRIAVDVRADDKDEMEGYPDHYSDSDDGVMLKRLRTKKQTAKSMSMEDKTIAKLPSTTLKDRKDTRHPRSPPLSPSSSQEAMLPSKPSTRFLIDDDDDEQALLISGRLLLLADSGSSSSKSVEMCRTSSGLLISYEEGVVPTSDKGVYGGVLDKVDTTRRIPRLL